MSLAGLTVTQAEKRIADGLRDGNFVKQPQVSILVTQVRGNQVSVLGQVGRPGRFPLETGDVQLTDIIATAGGIAASGADTVVVVGRATGSLTAPRSTCRRSSAPGERGEDVDPAERRRDLGRARSVIYLYGEVQRPGSLRLERGMTRDAGAGQRRWHHAARHRAGLRVHRRTPTARSESSSPR